MTNHPALPGDVVPSDEAVPANDPVRTNPGHYRVILENERVRVLEYRDSPGDKTTPHFRKRSHVSQFRLSCRRAARRRHRP